jgi:hypothetical protein
LTFELAIRAAARYPGETMPKRYEVFRDDLKYGDLVQDGPGYFGVLPTHEHTLENADGQGITAWKRLARDINARAAALESSVRGLRSHSLAETLERARKTSAEFFEEIGVLPGEAAGMDGCAQRRFQTMYVDWLFAKIGASLPEDDFA